MSSQKEYLRLFYAVEIPEFMGIGPIDLTFPSLKVCVDWYSFPTMKIFDIEFSAMVVFFPLILFVAIFLMRA